MQKLCLSTKFLHQEITKIYGILRSAYLGACQTSIKKQFVEIVDY